MTYEVSQREIPDQPVMSIRDQIDEPDMPAFVGRAFDELLAHLRLLGVAVDGEPFVIYHAFGPDLVDAEVCLPLTEEVAASGRIIGRVVPAATVASTLHVGPYEALGSAYGTLTDWLELHGFVVAGPVRERYLNSPGDDLPPAEYRTVVEMPIAEVAVLAH